MYIIEFMFWVAISLGIFGILGGVLVFFVAPPPGKRAGFFLIALGLLLLGVTSWGERREKRTVERFMQAWHDESLNPEPYHNMNTPHRWSDYVDWHRADQVVPRDLNFATRVPLVSYDSIVKDGDVKLDLRAGEFIEAGTVKVKIFSTNVNVKFQEFESAGTVPMHAKFLVTCDDHKIVKMQMGHLEDFAISEFYTPTIGE